jgi:hypothetical protein
MRFPALPAELGVVAAGVVVIAVEVIAVEDPALLDKLALVEELDSSGRGSSDVLLIALRPIKDDVDAEAALAVVLRLPKVATASGSPKPGTATASY